MFSMREVIGVGARDEPGRLLPAVPHHDRLVGEGLRLAQRPGGLHQSLQLRAGGGVDLFTVLLQVGLGLGRGVVSGPRLVHGGAADEIATREFLVDLRDLGLEPAAVRPPRHPVIPAGTLWRTHSRQLGPGQLGPDRPAQRMALGDQARRGQRVALEAGDQRRRHHGAVVAHLRQPPPQPVPHGPADLHEAWTVAARPGLRQPGEADVKDTHYKTVGTRRLIFVLLGIFAGLAVALTAIGIALGLAAAAAFPEVLTTSAVAAGCLGGAGTARAGGGPGQTQRVVALAGGILHV